MNNVVRTPLGKLNLTDRFLFAETMDEPEAYEAVVGILLEDEIEFLDFMEYINDTRDAVVARSTSARVKLVHSKVEKIRRSEKCGVKYMQRWEEIAYAQEDGYEEGRNEGELRGIIAAACKKLAKGKDEEQIADELEQGLECISQICRIAEKYAPPYDQDMIYRELVQGTYTDAR